MAARQQKGSRPLPKKVTSDVAPRGTAALGRCQEVLGYEFRDPGWLELALTHSSERCNARASNERLEFLGDAVLGTVVSRWLFDLLPEASEGELTRIKSVMVSRNGLVGMCQRLGLGRFIRVGRGLAGQQLPRSILANTLEAVIAAIYLDGGLRRTQGFIKRHLRSELEAVLSRKRGRNFKSLLQQLVQAQGWVSPQYRVIEARGPDHDREFEVEVLVSGRRHGRGVGRTKRQAEQRAAEVALKQLQDQGLSLPE